VTTYNPVEPRAQPRNSAVHARLLRFALFRASTRRHAPEELQAVGARLARAFSSLAADEIIFYDGKRHLGQVAHEWIFPHRFSGSSVAPPERNPADGNALFREWETRKLVFLEIDVWV